MTIRRQASRLQPVCHILVVLAIACSSHAQPTEPCTIDIAYQGLHECVFLAEGIPSDPACAQLEEEIGNSTGISATRYSYLPQYNEGCGVAVPGQPCSAYTLAEFLPQCNATISAQVQSMLASLSVPIEGPLAPAPAQQLAVPNEGCYSDVMDGYVPLCTIVSTGISSDSACTADGEFGAGLAGLAGADVGVKAFYYPEEQACLVSGLGTCDEYVAVLGIPLGPCANATTAMIQAGVDQGLYDSTAPATAPAPPARTVTRATAPK